jgi:beta-xylosidase
MSETIQPITKKKKKKVRYKEFHKRQFLNLPNKESNAFIAVHMTNEKWNGYVIRITDCNERITLHGSLAQLKSRKNAIHKVDRLIETLHELREHMVAEFKRNNLKH